MCMWRFAISWLTGAVIGLHSRNHIALALNIYWPMKRVCIFPHCWPIKWCTGWIWDIFFWPVLLQAQLSSCWAQLALEFFSCFRCRIPGMPRKLGRSSTSESQLCCRSTFSCGGYTPKSGMGESGQHSGWYKAIFAFCLFFVYRMEDSSYYHTIAPV